MVAIPEFYDKAGDMARRFEVEDLASLIRASDYPTEEQPYEVALPRLPFLDRESVADVQGLGSLPTVRLERRVGRLSAEIMVRFKDALAFALDLYRNAE